MTQKTVTIANQAGSAGKSTFVTAAAAVLARQGSRVCVWDLDSQANATQWLGVDPDTVQAHSGDVLLRRSEAVDALVQTPIEGIWLVPGHVDLAADLVELQTTTTALLRLRKPIGQLAAAQGFDVVLIDCPGSLSPLTWAALAVSTGVVTVATPTMKELRGIGPFVSTVEQAAEELGTQVQVDAIVPCMVPPANAGRVYAEAMEWLREQYGDLVTPPIRRSALVAEASSNGEPVTLYVPNEPVSQDVEKVVADLQQRGVL